MNLSLMEAILIATVLLAAVMAVILVVVTVAVIVSQAFRMCVRFAWAMRERT